MAKLKAPLLSFAATQTIADALTFSRYKRLHVAKRIPTHPDAQTDAQLAQRERYSHARDYWLTLTPGEKAALLTQGRPYSITGYNLLMRRYLTDLLHLEAWWPLNDAPTAITHDFSPHSTHGTVFGCIAADDYCGQLNNAMFWDGLNDRVVATTPQLNFTTQDFSVTFRTRPTALTGDHYIIVRGLWQADGWTLGSDVGGTMFFRTHQLLAMQQTLSNFAALAPATWATVGLSRQGNTATFYVNGVEATFAHGNHIDPTTSARTLKLGARDDLAAAWFHGRLCDVKLYSLSLTPAQQLAIHQRYCVHPPR